MLNLQFWWWNNFLQLDNQFCNAKFMSKSIKI